MRISIFFFLSVFLFSCAATIPKKPMINGVSFVASREALYEQHIEPVVNINANYAAIMPFGFIRDLNEPKIAFNTERQWYGETKAGAKQNIEALKKKHIKIMLKPQVWVWHGEFTGNIEMSNEEDWSILEDSYSEFILLYAKLAQETKVEILCIGTELKKFIANRPQFWFELIKKIRSIYKGQLTYAANWDEFKRTPFWRELDYIGIDAYFPVSDNKTPTVEDCKVGWQEHKALIKTYSKQFNKPVLFTEYGYRSVDFTGKEPWKSDRNMTQVNLEAQTNATKALFEEFWKEDWFAGGFIWKWYHHHHSAGGEDNTRFTPQNKPVEDVVREVYLTN
ncbi:MAG: glycoside hydrolase [Bacteroidetes bacterium]|nr:MAG: glycoside hydrolase [Bacteroidota bacterium]